MAVTLPTRGRIASLPAELALGVDEPNLPALTAAALQAAHDAGSAYTDLRFTQTRRQFIGLGSGQILPPQEHLSYAVGVRVLVDDVWGFAAGPSWILPEVVRLATEACQQARANAWVGRPPIRLTPLPAPAKGNWETPIKYDPFSLSAEDKLALILSIQDAALALPRVGVERIETNWQRQDKVFASSDGAYITQVLYTALGNNSRCTFEVVNADGSARQSIDVPAFQPTGGGFEVLSEANIEEHVPDFIESARRSLINQAPVEPGLYDCILAPNVMASIVNGTVGKALELDRALGFEANADGTSYLAPPESVIGSMFAPEFVTVTANRSQRRGAATVRWDDDGVEPSPYQLIERGKVVTYLKSRGAPDPSSRVAAGSMPQGNAAAPDAFSPVMEHLPNLVLEPAAGGPSLDELIRHTDRGVLVLDAQYIEFDQQIRNAFGVPNRVFEIKQGKIARPLTGGMLQFHTQSFWKNIKAIGGAASAEVYGFEHTKGNPAQTTEHNVTAVPARAKDVHIVRAY